MGSPTASANPEAGQLIEPASDAWLGHTSVDDVWTHTPERIDTLLTALNLDHPGP